MRAKWNKGDTDRNRSVGASTNPRTCASFEIGGTEAGGKDLGRRAERVSNKVAAPVLVTLG